MNFEAVTKPYLDTKVDNLDILTGQIDLLPSLTLDIPDAQIIANLNNRIDDAQGYWQSPNGYDLKTHRAKNVKLYLGKQIDEGQLYRFQVPYMENQIYKSTEAIVAYLTSQLPQGEVYPASDSDQSKIMAIHLEKGLRGWAAKQNFDRELENATRNLLLKRIGLLYFWYDPDWGQNGEIRVKAVDPDHVIIDKNAEQGMNPAFICLLRKDSVEQLCYRFPEKKAKIMEELGIKRGTPKQMSQIVVWRQVWLTHYDDKGKPGEGCVSYFGSLVLSKYKDPNWLYADPSKNFLDMPTKPFIPLNYINDGAHWIDHTTPIEQASWLQEVLNKRGRQIMENADTANGFLFISSDAMSMDDAENLTGDPNQKVVVDTNSQPIDQLIKQIEARELPAYVIEDKADLRNVIGDIMGVPSQFAGDENNQTDTLGQAIMIKNQASGRQDLIVRAIDKCADAAYKFVVQMMVAHYTEEHYQTVNGGDGEFDFIALHRNIIDPRMDVCVKGGSTLPFDKSREEAITLNLAKEGLLSPLDVYKGLHMDNPQRLYDNMVKWKADPQSLARDALDQLDDTEAYIEYVQILDGQKVKPKQDATTHHILAHRRQMITDEFLEAAKKNKKVLKNMTDLVTKEVNSLQLRTDLDFMSQQGAEALLPSTPIEQAPPQGQPEPMMGGMGPDMPPMGAAPPPGPMGGPQPMPMNPNMAPGPLGAPPAPMGIPGPSVGAVMGAGPLQPPPAPNLAAPGQLPLVL